MLNSHYLLARLHFVLICLIQTMRDQIGRTNDKEQCRVLKYEDCMVIVI